MLRSTLLTVALAVLSPLALADVQFTSPAAGASIPAGPITITWKDSGVAPALSTFTTYTIQLMVGGNDGTATPLLTFPATPPGQFSDGNSITGTVPAGVSGTLANGYFLKIQSTSSQGGIVVNYSKRFSMTGMTGTAPATAVTAVQALGGTLDGPPTENGVSNQNPAAGAGGAGAGGDTGVPYRLQTGLTKYAPMQPIPPTKITKKNPTPLNPTSAYSIAKTWMPQPTILTTITASQTFSVSSMENTAAAQSNPTGDMAKFLNRWKD